METTTSVKHEEALASPSVIRITSHCRFGAGDEIGVTSPGALPHAHAYTIVRQLGKGRMATVWEALNKITGESVAIKVFRIGSSIYNYYVQECKILNNIWNTDTAQCNNLIQYKGTFAHIAFTPDMSPNIHPCLIFNLYGDSISALLKHCRRRHHGGIPLPLVKKIMRDTLQGLAFLHSRGITHTDIKPGNLLLSDSIEMIESSGTKSSDTNFSVYVADLGTSCIGDDIFSYHVGTTEYCAPELIFEMKYGPPIDIWAAFSMCYELITGDLLFDVYNICGVKYGEDVEDILLPYRGGDSHNSKISQCSKECEEAEDDEDNCSGSIKNMDVSESDSSGSEDENLDTLNYRHLLIIEKIIGSPPKKFAKKNGATYYNSNGKLKNHSQIEKVGIVDRLFTNYNIDIAECKRIEEFLLAGLKFVSGERISSIQALQHPWLNQ